MSSTTRAWVSRFFMIWIGQIFSLVGSGLVHFAVIWWLTVRTGSATVLATVTLAGTLPGILLGPLAGACVDRWNRRLVLIASDGIVALVSAGLALLAWGGHLDVWHVYVAMALRSAAGTFHWPAMQASTTLLVPSEHLTRVSGMNETLHGILNIVSPPLGAVLMAALPLHGVLAIDVGTAALAILPLLAVAIPQPKRQSAPEHVSTSPAAAILADMRAGLAYVWHWPAIMGVIGMAMIINMVFNPAFSLLPLFVSRHMGGEAIQLGTVNSAFGIGVVAGGVLLSVWGGFRRTVLTSMVGVIGMGVSVLLLGFAPDRALWMVIAGMLLNGLFQPLANGPLHALLQRTVPPEMQGRVLTVLGSGCGAIAPLGLALAGPVADAVGIRPIYVVAGIVAALAGIWGLQFRPFMEMEKGAPQPATSAGDAPAVESVLAAKGPIAE